MCAANKRGPRGRHYGSASDSRGAWLLIESPIRACDEKRESTMTLHGGKTLTKSSLVPKRGGMGNAFAENV